MDLTYVVNTNDALYKMRLLPKAGLFDDQYRKDVAQTWSFERFVREMAYPYWKKKGLVHSLDELWSYGDLAHLLKGNPANVHVVLAADDPLNDPAQLVELRKHVKPDRLTVLPRGGHMGYVGTKWAKARVQRLFE